MTSIRRTAQRNKQRTVSFLCTETLWGKNKPLEGLVSVESSSLLLIALVYGLHSFTNVSKAFPHFG